MFKEYFKKYKAKDADLSDVRNLKNENFETSQKARLSFVQLWYENL